MNQNKRFDHEELQSLVEKAHQRAGGTLGNVKINLLVKQSAWLFSELLNRELGRFGLNCVGYVVLLTLYSTSKNQANPSDICVCTGETRANMTRICDDLVREGWVARVNSAKDRRRIDLSLTPKGVVLMDEIIPAIQKRVQEVYIVFNDTEKASLENLSLKLMRALEAAL
jgi:MarR family transcriptional regulator, negative regulator of the multidrug operon emrRAB